MPPLNRRTEVVVIDDDTIESQSSTASPGSISHQSRLTSFRSGGMILRSGKTVELTDGRFLRIKSVWQNTQTTEVFLTGALIWRARMLDGLSSPNCNETCWVRDKIMDDPLRIDEIPLASVLRIRQLRMTDRPYDDFNVTHTLEIATPYATVRDQGILFCRYKHVRIYTTHAQRGHRGNSHFIEKSIVGLRHDEADPEWRSNELERGRRSVSTTTLVGDNEPYTFGDAFCGAGGMSCGARLAGLKVKWGLERDIVPARTYQKNFINAICEVASVDQFVHFPAYEFRVDILHFSPPCQSFSPMQTRRGSDWEEKQVAILSISELVKMLRPRMITMEETFGLHFEKNMDFFVTVVRTLNDYGYSVRWKIMNLMDHGVPQPRRRLILIAAAFGEFLPPFPRPTHLQQPTTIATSIADIPTNATLHTFAPFPAPRPPYNPHGPLRNLIATNGGENNYHPSGQRPFTVREFACLQTFPHDFEFEGTKTQVIRQIGNAVPPIAAKAILEEIVKTLKKTDMERS